MDYGKLLFLAPAWLEVLDPTTKTMTLKAVGDALDAKCLIQAEPIPGTDPVQYRYTCLSVNCDTTCLLRRQVLPEGVKYWCECKGGNG